MMEDINNALLHIKAKHNGEIPYKYGSQECAKLMHSYAEEYHKRKLKLLGVSQRTFTSTCTEVEDMAVEIDQFINQHALAKPMTYSRKLRQYLANKLNEYVG